MTTAALHCALNVTPAGVPVVGALGALALLLFLLWDALRRAGEPWFRWLLPVGFCMLLGSLAIGIPAILVSGGVMGLGLGLSSYWRWTGRNALARRKSRTRRRLQLPPLDS
ncbi:hypothetical protein GL263_06115 [Streptomyces durbertensis]|uniref:Uncharacterized protein n=1 Tax=Streptomyces durbertensis TaxID=2448886 RepID=A0ABR6ECT3_9ACTN|nr:hypothetical protein [Streptomyces durbertensis]MBB1243142.1 hypothetical protein [Streptomyces durbertensis]